MAHRDSFAPGTPSWVDVASTDGAAARAFYSRLFGWDVQVSPDPEAGGYAIAHLEGVAVAGLSPKGPGMEAMPDAWAVSFSTDDIDATVEAVTANGGTVMYGPFPIMEEGHMAGCTDSNGTFFGLWQAGRHIGARIVNEPGTFCWNELAADDVAKAVEFYDAALGVDGELTDDGNGAHFAVGGKDPEPRARPDNRPTLPDSTAEVEWPRVMVTRVDSTCGRESLNTRFVATIGGEPGH